MTKTTDQGTAFGSPEALERTFWGLAAEIEWEKQEVVLEEDFPPAAWRVSLLRRFTSEELEGLLTFLDERVGDLRGRVEAVYGPQALGLSDDGTDDLYTHIVGLGEEQFRLHLSRPDLILQRARDDRFRESFRYMFLVEWERKFGEIDTIREMARDVLRKSEPRPPIPKDMPEGEGVEEDLIRLQEALELLVEDGTVESFMEQESDMRRIAGRCLVDPMHVNHLLRIIRTYHLPLRAD